MATLTAHFGLLKPVVNDPIDQDQWGYQLNTDWDSVDALHYAWSTTSIGTVRPDYAKAGTQWINNTTTPWVWNVFSGTTDIVLGNIDTVTNTFTPGGTAALTTKGDLLTYSTQPVRLGVGTNGQVLTADSTQADGVKWSSNNSIAAWCSAKLTFIGPVGSFTINAGFNITSITYTEKGKYVAIFTNPLPSANYAASGMAQRISTDSGDEVIISFQKSGSISAGSCPIATKDSAGDLVDVNVITLMFVGG